MDIVETVSHSLDYELQNLCKKRGLERNEVFSRVSSFIDENSEEWRKEEPDIDYGNPFCRLAYLYINVPVHAELIKRAFANFSELWSEISNRDDLGNLGVCAMGGGPGAELLGFSRFVSSRDFSDSPVIADFLLIDRVAEWDETWHVLKRSIDRSFYEQFGSDRQNWPLFASRSFLPLSLTDSQDFSFFSARFKRVRIYILSYVVSELLRSKEDLEGVIEYLCSLSGTGTKFLFIDRSQPEVVRAVNDVVEQSSYLISSETLKTRDEWKTDFEKAGDWYYRIPRLPRSKWQSFFHLAEISS